MVVRTVNNVFPDFSGNLTLNLAGTLYDSTGAINKPIKMWTGATTVGSDGTWSVNYSNVNFANVMYVHFTLEAIAGMSNADKPLGGHIVSKSLTGASGKAHKVSSAGLLAAMQQVNAEPGTIVNVMVIGV